MSTAAEPLLRCRRLQVGYGGKALFPPISLEVRRGQHWAVVGRNGAGKSTLLKTLLGLQPALDGSVEHLVPELRTAWVAQRAGFDRLYPVTAAQVTAMGLESGWSFLRFSRRGLTESVRAALELVGASDLADRTFRSLSEGQKQRVLLARLAASKPDLAVLDEPTASMDRAAEHEALEILDRLRERLDMAVLIVGHNLTEAEQHATDALFIDDLEGVAVVGRPDKVFSHPVLRDRFFVDAIRNA